MHARATHTRARAHTQAMHYGYTCVCLQLAFLAANTIDHDFNIFRYSGEVFGTNQLRGAESYLRREKVFSYSRNSIHIM